eukprot:SAG31_NODE_14306_length_815_cov_1.166201_2_plen_120_part_01
MEMVPQDGDPGVENSSMTPVVSKLIIIRDVPASSAQTDTGESTRFKLILLHPAVTVVDLLLILATIVALALDSPYAPPPASSPVKIAITAIEVLSSAIWTIFLLASILSAGWHGYVYDDT